MRDKNIRYGTIVLFESEGKTILGTVIKMDSGLFGIIVEGVKGTFWRDDDALSPIRLKKSRRV